MGPSVADGSSPVSKGGERAVGGRVHPQHEEIDVAYRYRRGISLIGLIYILIGLYVAWVYDYITPALLKDIAEALLAVVLWFLILLGVDLHLGG
jgi:hypothetical protein